MMIMIAGPYSAPTEQERQDNLDRMNVVAAQVCIAGHTPIIGVNAALPVVQQALISDPANTLMDISLALAERCDAILMLAESPGANRERDVFLRKGLPVYTRLEELPPA